jgi:hypothetical protein
MPENIKDYPFILLILLLPFFWLIAILKILIMIPFYVVAKCNDILSEIN